MSSNHNNWMYEYYTKLYSDTTQQNATSSSSSSSSSTNDTLLNLLFNHKIIIQNLLENQNSLKDKVQKLINTENHSQSNKYDFHTNNNNCNISIPFPINNYNNYQNNNKNNLNNNIQNINNININNNMNNMTSTNINNNNNTMINMASTNINNMNKNMNNINNCKINSLTESALQKQTNYVIRPVHKKTRIQIVSTCPDVQNQSNQSYEIKSHHKVLIPYPNYNQNQTQNEQKQTKGCQTKNVIKNYGKSILTFIRKNQQLIQKISVQLGFDQKQFFYQFSKFRGNVNSISQLKVFWTQKGNPFAKIFRIISNLYLKKHSIKHTFNSRVKNYSLHIKYRKRLLDILKNPQDFTSLKCV